VGKIFLLLCGVLTWTLQAQTPVTATATPATLTFTYQSGATALPAAQSISLKASSGTPAFTVAISPNTDLWLIASPGSGNLPGTLSVRVNPTSLGVGIYNATVAVTVTGVANPVNIPVTLTVTAAPSTLTLSQTTLTFTAPPIPVNSQTLTLSTNGAPISYTATGSTWMTVSPAIGVVLPGDPVTLTVAVDPSSLTPQTAPYTAKITIVASGASVTAKSQNVTVNLTLNSTAPTITSVWPSTLPVNGGAQTLTIRGTNFYAATVAKIQGVATALATTVLSPTGLLAVIPATSLTAAGTLNVLAENPAPGGDSATSPVTVASIPTIIGVVDAASYAVGPVSPGQLVTIFGTNIGPAVPLPMSIANGYVATSLGGVSVTIDGQNAPLIYVSANQISAQVPYEATVGANKQVSLTNGANPAATATVTIAATSPGIFTADGSGAGQAAALNYSAATTEYTLNSSTNPAKIGDTVLLYLTGEGNYNAAPLSGVALASNTGYIIPASLSSNLPQVNPLPTVTIGGANATVAYAGPIVGSILGVLQMNVVVPTGSATGAAVAVAVTIGGNSTQSNVTLSIHP
jgi:uncharacterized protein (TIGR03437 family)